MLQPRGVILRPPHGADICAARPTLRRRAYTSRGAEACKNSNQNYTKARLATQAYAGRVGTVPRVPLASALANPTRFGSFETLKKTRVR